VKIVSSAKPDRGAVCGVDLWGFKNHEWDAGSGSPWKRTRWGGVFGLPRPVFVKTSPTTQKSVKITLWIMKKRLKALKTYEVFKTTQSIRRE